ncbi:MAG: hypothetical protein FJ146_06125 [Deltaproteobacteria bacterium]|nr:hypothetical protein [Deltaproteobacteria bacterium]
MILRQATNLVLLVTILGGCNNPLSQLDRGKIKVNGLARPQQLAPPIIKNAKQGEAIRAGAYQTRQSVSFMIPEDVVLQGTHLGLRRKAPEPSQEITAPTLIPSSGTTTNSGDVTVEHLATGGAKISFYAGTLIATKSMVYGDNTLQLTLYADDTPTYQADIIVQIRDFTIGGAAMVGMLKSPPDAPLKSEAWLSPIKETTVTSGAGDTEQPPSLLRSGLMSIIHP